jgi:hypothetical protein
MERIYPLTVDHLQHIIGMPVCAVAKNGLRYVGIAESCANGRLVLVSPCQGDCQGLHFSQPYGNQSAYEREQGSSNEQSTSNRRTTTGKKSKGVRGKKQRQGDKATSASIEAHSTNYAQSKQNPAHVLSRSGSSGVAVLNLDDIGLLFLII